MDLHDSDENIAIYQADLREVSDLGSAARLVASPPYNSGVCYDVHRDAMADGDYQELAESAAGMMAFSLRAEGGRAWVSIGVTQLRTWLDALGTAGLRNATTTTTITTIAWDYGLATADTARGSWQSPSAPHLRYGFEPVICAWADQWRRTPPPGFEAWRDEVGNWPALCRKVWRMPRGHRPAVNTRR